MSLNNVDQLGKNIPFLIPTNKSTTAPSVLISHPFKKTVFTVEELERFLQERDQTQQEECNEFTNAPCSIQNQSDGSKTAIQDHVQSHKSILHAILVIYWDAVKIALTFTFPCILVILFMILIPWGLAEIESVDECGLSQIGSVREKMKSSHISNGTCSGVVSINTSAIWISINVSGGVCLFLCLSISMMIGRPYPPRAVFRAQRVVYVLFFVFVVTPAVAMGVWIPDKVFFYYGEFIGLALMIPLLSLLTSKSRTKNIERYSSARVVPKPAIFRYSLTESIHKPKKAFPPWIIATLSIFVISFYIVIFIPYFRVSSDLMKMVVRLVFHPTIVAFTESLLRDQAARSTRSSQIYAKCTGLFVSESIFSLVGRFFVYGQTSTTSTILTILLAGCQEFLIRTHIIEIGKIKRKIFRQRQLNDAELLQFKIVIAVDNVSEMSIEMWSIVVAGTCELMMYQYPMSFDLGFNTWSRPTLLTVLGWIALQLFLEAIIDILCAYVQMKKRIPLVEASRGRPQIVTLFFIIASLGSLFAMLACYKVSSYVSVCDQSNDICSCIFSKSNGGLNLLSCICGCS